MLQVLNFLISAEVVWISLTFISVMGLGFGEGVGKEEREEEWGRRGRGG